MLKRYHEKPKLEKFAYILRINIEQFVKPNMYFKCIKNIGLFLRVLKGLVMTNNNM